jgi:hypothetical protein
MVIIRISHGLGNQMFQYAMGRALANANDAPLKLDLSHFSASDTREYGLQSFQIEADTASTTEVTVISGRPPGERRKGLAKNLAGLRRRLGGTRHVVREKSRRFDPHALEERGELYVMGYWQALAYVEAAATSVRREFRFSDALSEEDRQLLDAIGNQPTVAVHVRRGDYVGHQRFEMVNPLEYYQAAIDRVAERIEGLTGIVFSDDPKWAVENVRSSIPLQYVDGNEGNPAADLRLMSACSHQVIANSTFSWWGAWLNQNPAKIVCAPKIWWRSEPDAGKDLLPENWLKIDTEDRNGSGHQTR